MAYDADIVVDRRRMKRRLFVWQSLGIVALVALTITVVGRFTGLEIGGYIARLSVEGIIINEPRRLALLHGVAENSRIRALILRIDSPGGTVVGGESLYRAIMEVAGKKPVVAVIGQLGTSAAYMAALPANRIFAHEGSVTGSIGVILQATEITGLLKMLGISAEAIKSGPLKATPNPLEQITPAAREAAQLLVDDLFEMFLDMVVKGRNLTKDDVRKIADGRVFTGRMALKNGLVDEIGGEREAVAWLEREQNIPQDLRIRDVRVRSNVSGLLDSIEGLARKTVLSERLTLDGLVSLWHPAMK